MKPLLADYIFDERLRYEGHKLIYTPEGTEPMVLGGILGAALLAALLVDTEEGDAHNIAIDTDAERADFFTRYDREVRRDDWGYLSAEVNQLRDNYVQIVTGENNLSDICPNNRLLNLAMELTVAYMRHLVLKIFRDHI